MTNGAKKPGLMARRARQGGDVEGAVVPEAGAVEVMSDKWHVRFHAANPNMATVFGPQFKASPACEGGRWYTSPETANLIAAAPELLEALEWLMRAPRKSADKDNMEFDVRATCFAVDKAIAAIAMARGTERS